MPVMAFLSETSGISASVKIEPILRWRAMGDDGEVPRMSPACRAESGSWVMASR